MPWSFPVTIHKAIKKRTEGEVAYEMVDEEKLRQFMKDFRGKLQGMDYPDNSKDQFDTQDDEEAHHD